jgi:hypothetical protein
VLVNDDGKPVVPTIVEHAKKNYAVMKAKSPGKWAEE